jgi:dihydrofolate reductase
MEKSMIRAILAHDAYWGIGKDGDLPWPKNADDLKWFKETTTGSAIVMGRKTWESFPKKPLPNRQNIVVSSKEIEGAKYTFNKDNYEKRIVDLNYEVPVWIIGGAQLVETCLPIIDELWLNDVGGVYDCDTFLPKQKITEKFHAGTVEVLSFGIITKWVRK